MQCQAGWLAAALELWQDLREDLHATTQVLARLASQSPCWSGGGAAEPCYGYVNVLGKDLAGVSQTVPAKILLGGLGHPIFTKIHMPLRMRPWVLVSTLSMVSELSTSRVVLLLVPCKSSRQGSCRGLVSRPS